MKQLKKILILLICSIMAMSGLMFLANHYLLPPNIWIDGVNVGLYLPSQAQKKLSAKNTAEEGLTLKLKGQNQSFEIEQKELGIHQDAGKIIAQIRHSQQFASPLVVLQTWAQAFFRQEVYYSPKSLDREKTKALITKLFTSDNTPGKKPSFALGLSNQPKTLTLDVGLPGSEIDLETTLNSLTRAINQTEQQNLKLEVTNKPIYPTLDQNAQKLALNKALVFVGKELTFVDDLLHLSIKITDQELIKILNPVGDYYLEELDLVINKVATQVEMPPEDAVLEFDPNTLAVSRFEASKPGVALDRPKTKQAILRFLQSDTELKEKQKLTASLPIKSQPPNRSLNQTNSLGIDTELGFGESYFAHSIPSRVHNVGLAGSKVQNIIIAPGEEFSFNKTLGEVSKATGFQQAYVIRSGRTELGDGGGICQVSTTLFRATLDAGLKITKRLPHSYRVSYYELDSKPGIDATVYSGEVDFRFINDTPAHILIHSLVDKEKLYMSYQIFGTNDGRTSEITEHQTWGWQAPLPAQYIKDPTLPAGVTKQIDWSASGINAKFTHIIKDKFGNITSQKTYFSRYKPWSAKFLVGGTE